MAIKVLCESKTSCKRKNDSRGRLETTKEPLLLNCQDKLAGSIKMVASIENLLMNSKEEDKK